MQTNILHYDVSLTFAEALLSNNIWPCSGFVAIHLQQAQEWQILNGILANSETMDIASVKIGTIQGKHIANFSYVETDKKKKKIQLQIRSEKAIPAGNAVIEIGFKSRIKLNTMDVHGLYTTHENNSAEIVTLQTDFEPRYAHYMFPCFDKFSCKATFQLRLAVPTWLFAAKSDTFVAISNTPIVQESSSKSSTKKGGMIKHYLFDKTPKMSTYLLAFCVGFLQVVGGDSYYSNLSYKDIPVRIIASQPSSGVQVVSYETILKSTIQTLEKCEEYFQVPYDLAKVDVVLVPRLSFGGMENWACIFLSQTNLFIKEGSKAVLESNAHAFVELIIHEVAHFWVGNLVTFPIWCTCHENKFTNLVKEGLAQYFEMYFGDQILGRNTALPKEIQAIKPKMSADDADFSQVYNGVTYNQSKQWILARVIALGHEEFKTRLVNLVQQHVYGEVSEEDALKLI